MAIDIQSELEEMASRWFAFQCELCLVSYWSGNPEMEDRCPVCEGGQVKRLPVAQRHRLSIQNADLLHAAEHGLTLMVSKRDTDEKYRLYHRCDDCERAIKFLQSLGRMQDVDLTITVQEEDRAKIPSE